MSDPEQEGRKTTSPLPNDQTVQPMTTLSTRKKILHNLILLALVLAGVTLIYLAATVSRSWPLYDYIKNNERGWQGNVFQSDPVLGFKAVPLSEGYEIMPDGFHIPVRFDEQGFRVSTTGSTAANTAPSILFLGDSFTYGAAVAAEKIFTHLVGQKFDAPIIIIAGEIIRVIAQLEAQRAAEP